MREKRGWTQTDIQKLIGINNSVLSRIESGKRPVESEELKKFAQLFDTNTDYLSCNTDDPSPLTKKYTYPPPSTTDLIIKEIVEKYNIDLTESGNREKLEKIIELVVGDFERKSQ